MPHVQTTGFEPLSTALQGAGHARDRALQRTLRDSVADALGVTAKGHGIHGLAVSIRDKLAASGAGTDAVPAVMETINRALDDAATKLAAQGVSRDDIDAGLARFRNKLAQEVAELAGSNASDDATTTERSAIAAREEVRERFSLDVLTSEGDKVSIRFKSLNVTEVSGATVANGSDSVTKFEASVISRGRFQVQVDGDLNDAERTAIANLLDKVDDIATDFFGGDVQAAFAAAARVGLESEALSAFDLKLSYSRSLAAVKTYASNAQLGDAATQSKPDVPATDPVNLPAETAAPSNSAPDAPALVSESAVEPTTDPVTPPAIEGTPTSAAVAHNAAKASSAIETIARFAKDVLERLDEAGESKATKFSLKWKVEFMIKAFGSVALTPIERKAAEALGIALDGHTPA